MFFFTYRLYLFLLAPSVQAFTFTEPFELGDNELNHHPRNISLRLTRSRDIKLCCSPVHGMKPAF
jgi:hypothetical protein